MVATLLSISRKAQGQMRPEALRNAPYAPNGIINSTSGNYG